jgi:hypothetical protein
LFLPFFVLSSHAFLLLLSLYSFYLPPFSSFLCFSPSSFFILLMLHSFLSNRRGLTPVFCLWCG